MFIKLPKGQGQFDLRDIVEVSDIMLQIKYLRVMAYCFWTQRWGQNHWKNSKHFLSRKGNNIKSLRKKKRLLL